MITEPNFLWYEPVSDTYWEQKPADVSGYTKYIRADIATPDLTTIKAILGSAIDGNREGLNIHGLLVEALAMLEAGDD